MEYYWTLFNNSNGSGTSTTTSAHLPAPHNRNFTHAWDLPTTSQHNNSQLFCNPDPHLTCLKLGKRHYFEDLTPPSPPPPPPVFSIAKRGKSCVAAAEAAVPRCQVEGCEAVLVNAKDYHRRHKVCEMHAKAPKVVVLGMEQRFCQQCSRFHGLAEFDEAKRSCRRRLAGHNERRRKSSQEHNSLARRNYQGVQGQLVNNGECALSLLSPNYPWTTSSSPDLPARCSAALRELIAENRASLMGCRQLINPNNFPESRGHVTLNLMQAQESAFALLSPHTNNNNNNNRSSQDDAADADCSDLWKLPLGY